MLSAVQYVDKGTIEQDIEAEKKTRRKERKKEKKACAAHDMPPLLIQTAYMSQEMTSSCKALQHSLLH